MSRWYLDRVTCAVVTSFLCLLGGCGGHTPPGPLTQPASITLSPSPSTSVQVGSIIIFTPSARNATNTNISTTFTFQSSNTDVLNIAANGVACAGHWDASFTVCTPQGTGVVQVTASALGATSAPTQVFVHPPIDNIEITVVPPVGSPPQACPGQQIIPAACSAAFTPVKGCLSPNQLTTVQATAFSKGVDITPLVGPFTWSEGNTNPVKVTPITSSSNNTPTNQATVTPNTPGFTPVFATASGVSSHPYYAETCPVRCIALELGTSGSQTGGQTNFATTKGTAESITATTVDVQGCVVPKPSLTWSSSQPASVSASASCGTTCSAATPQPGSASVTASCTPPNCNIGFPQSVVGLNQPGQDPLVQPVPVYPVTAISGVVSGAGSATSVLASSVDCATTALCNVNLYNVASTATIGVNPIPWPRPPDSLLFDPAGDRAFAGSNFGALVIAVGSLGGTGNPFSSLGTVTGKVLGVSQNGSFAVFSDTFHVPNQVYVVSAAGTSTLNISGAIAAGFSPDGLKAFIIGCKATAVPPVPCNSSPGAPLTGNTLYIFSTLQSLQTVALSAPSNAIAFSSSGSFGLVTGGNFSTPPFTPSAITVNTCDNSSSALSLTAPSGGLPTPPLFLRMVPSGAVPMGNPLIPNLRPNLQTTGLDFFYGIDNTGIDIIATNSAATSFTTPCPQNVTLAQTNTSSPTTFVPIHVDLGVGQFNPINFFISPDSTLAYIVASDRSSVLAYNFNTNSTAGSIPLANSTTGQSVSPVAASMSVDGTLIYVATNDGILHQLNTVVGADLLQIPFPSNNNAFCPTNAPQPCNLNVVAVKP